MVLLTVYQLAREAAVNAIRHSGAERVWIRINQEADCIRLTVEDNGKGFDARSRYLGNHFGLSLMRERADAVGGVVVIDSRLGQGTRVSARLPRFPDDPGR